MLVDKNPQTAAVGRLAFTLKSVYKHVCVRPADRGVDIISEVKQRDRLFRSELTFIKRFIHLLEFGWACPQRRKNK